MPAQGERDLASLRTAEVECDPSLVGVDGMRQRSPLPPLRVTRPHDAGEAHEVRPCHRLHLDHVGTEEGQGLRGAGPGPPGREVDDPDPGERQVGAACAARPGAWHPLDRAVVGARLGHRPERARIDTVEAKGDAGLTEATGGMIHQHAAGDELLERQHGRAVEHRSHGDA